MHKIPVGNLRSRSLENALFHESGCLLFSPGETISEEEIGLLKLYGIKKVYELNQTIPLPAELQNQQVREMNLADIHPDEMLVGPIYDPEGSPLVEPDVVVNEEVLESLRDENVSRVLMLEEATRIPEQVRSFRRARQDLQDWKEMERTFRPRIRENRTIRHPKAELREENLQRLVDAEKAHDEPHGLALKEKVRLGGVEFRDREDREGHIFLEMRNDFLHILDRIFEDIRDDRRMQGEILNEVSRKLLFALLKDQYLLLNLVNLKEDVTRLSGHAFNVAVLTAAIALEMGYNQDRVFELIHAAFLHDVGMLEVPEEILLNPDELSESDWEPIHAHPLKAIELLRNIDQLPQVVPVIAYQEHERLDGTGYPNRIGSDGITLLAQIVAVADAYDAITSPRPHRPARTSHAAIRELVQMAAGREIDARPVRSLMRRLSLYPIGSWIQLGNGASGRVIGIRGEAARPLVRVLEKEGKPLEEPRTVNLAENPDLAITEILDRELTEENILEGF